eukprot:2757447-Lingulodinium_polyedra.AAC.1
MRLLVRTRTRKQTCRQCSTRSTNTLAGRDCLDKNNIGVPPRAQRADVARVNDSGPMDVPEFG